MDSASEEVRVDDEMPTSLQFNSLKESATRPCLNQTVKTSADTNTVRRQVNRFLKKIRRFKLIYKQFSSLKFRRHGKSSSMSGKAVLNSRTGNDKQALHAQMNVWFPSLFPRPTWKRLQEVIVYLKETAHSTGSRGEVMGLNPQLSEAKYQRKLFRKERLNQLLSTKKSARFVSTVVPQSQKRTKISTNKKSHNKTRKENSRKVLISTRDSSNSFDIRSAAQSHVENKPNLINKLMLQTQNQLNQGASSIESNQSPAQIPTADNVPETEKCLVLDWFRALLKDELVVDLSPSCPNIDHQANGDIAEIAGTRRRLVVSKCFQNGGSPADDQRFVLVQEQEEVRSGEMVSVTGSEEGGQRLSSEKMVYRRDRNGFSKSEESYRLCCSEISRNTQPVCLRAERTLGDKSASNKRETETGDANNVSATFEPPTELPAGHQEGDGAPRISSSLICDTQPNVSDGTKLDQHYNIPPCRGYMCHKPLIQYSQQPVSWCQANRCSVEPHCKRTVDQPPTPLNLLTLHQLPVQPNLAPLGYDQLEHTSGKESDMKQQQQPRSSDESQVSERHWGGRLPEENSSCDNGFVPERLCGRPLSFWTQASSQKVAGYSQTVKQLSTSSEVSRRGSDVRCSCLDARYARPDVRCSLIDARYHQSDVRCSIYKEQSRQRKCDMAPRPLPDLQPRATSACRLRPMSAPKPALNARNTENDYFEQSVLYLPGNNVDIHSKRYTFDEKSLRDPQDNFSGVCLPSENGLEHILDPGRNQKLAAKTITEGGEFKGDQNGLRRGIMIHNSSKNKSMKVNISKGGDKINRIGMKSTCEGNNQNKQTQESQTSRYVRSDVNDLVGDMETKFHWTNTSNSSVYGDASNLECDRSVVMDTFVNSCPVSKPSSKARSQNKEINDLEGKYISSNTKITSSPDLVASLQTFCAANSQKYSTCNYRDWKFLVRKSHSVTMDTVLSRLKNENTERGALLHSFSDSCAVYCEDNALCNKMQIINEHSGIFNNEEDMHCRARIKKYIGCCSALRRLKQRSDVVGYVKEQWRKRSSLTNLGVDADDSELSLANRRAGESDGSDSRLHINRVETEAVTGNSDALGDCECSCVLGEKELAEQRRERGGSGDNEVRKEFSYERMCADRHINYNKVCQAIDKYNQSTCQEDDERLSHCISLLIQKSKELTERLLTGSSRKEVSTISKIDNSDGDCSSKPEDLAKNDKSLLQLCDLKTKHINSITNKTSALSINDKQGGQARSGPVEPTLGKNDAGSMILFGVNKERPQMDHLIHSNVHTKGLKHAELRCSDVASVSVGLQDSSDNTAHTTRTDLQATRKVSAHSLSVVLYMMQEEISQISKKPDRSDETSKCPLGRFHSLLQTFDKFVLKFLQLNHCCCLSKHYKIRDAETCDCVSDLNNQTCYKQTRGRRFRINKKKYPRLESRPSPNSKDFHPFGDNCLSLIRENQTQNMTEPAQDRSVNNGRESPPVRINSKDPSVSEQEADDTMSVNSFENSQKANEQGGPVRREPGNVATTTQGAYENSKGGTSKPIATSSNPHHRHASFDISNPTAGKAFSSTTNVSKQLTLKTTDMESIEKRSERAQTNDFSAPHPELPNRLSVSTRLLGQGQQDSERKTPYLKSGVGTNITTNDFQGKSSDHYFPSNDQSNANPKTMSQEMHKNVSWQPDRGNPKLDTFVSSERRPVSTREQATASGQQTTASPRSHLSLWKQSSLVSERRSFISENTRDEFSGEFAHSPTRTGTCGYCGSHLNSERHARPYMTHDDRYFPNAPNDTGQPHKTKLDGSEFQRVPPDPSPAVQRSNRDYTGAAFSNTQPDLHTGARTTLPARDAVTNLFVHQTAVFAPKCSASTSPIKTASRLVGTDKSAQTATKSPSVPAAPMRTSIRDICTTILTANKASGSPASRQQQIHAGMRSESPRRRNLIQIPTREFACKRALRMDAPSPRKPPCPNNYGTLEADNRLLDPSKKYRDPSLLEEACARELDCGGQSAFQQYICSRLREIQAGRTCDSDTFTDDLIVFKCPSQPGGHKHPAQIKTCARTKYTRESQSPSLVTPCCKNERIIDRNHACIQTCACLCRPDGICVCGFLPMNPLGKPDIVSGSRSSSNSLRCRGICRHACIQTCDSEQDSDRIFGVDAEEEFWATPVVGTPACPYGYNKRNRKCQVGHQKVSRDIQTNGGTSFSRVASPYHKACSPFHLVGGTTPNMNFVATSQEPLCCKCRQYPGCAPGKVQEKQAATDSVGNLLCKNCRVIDFVATAPSYGQCKAGNIISSSGEQSRCGCRQGQQQNAMTCSNMCSQSEQESSLILAQFSQDCTDENWALPKKKKPVIHIRYKPKSSTFSPAVVGGQCPSDCLSQHLREEICKIVQNSKLLQQQVQQLRNKCKYLDSQQCPSTNQNRHDSASTDRRRCRSDRFLQCQQKEARQGKFLNKNDNANSPDVLHQGTTITHTSPNVFKPVRSTRTRMTKMIRGRLDRVGAVEAQSSSQLETPLFKFENKDGAVVLSCKLRDKTSKLQITSKNRNERTMSTKNIPTRDAQANLSQNHCMCCNKNYLQDITSSVSSLESGNRRTNQNEGQVPTYTSPQNEKYYINDPSEEAYQYISLNFPEITREPYKQADISLNLNLSKDGSIKARDSSVTVSCHQKGAPPDVPSDWTQRKSATSDKVTQTTNSDITGHRIVISPSEISRKNTELLPISTGLCDSRGPALSNLSCQVGKIVDSRGNQPLAELRHSQPELTPEKHHGKPRVVHPISDYWTLAYRVGSLGTAFTPKMSYEELIHKSSPNICRPGLGPCGDNLQLFRRFSGAFERCGGRSTLSAECIAASSANSVGTLLDRSQVPGCVPIGAQEASSCSTICTEELQPGCLVRTGQLKVNSNHPKNAQEAAQHGHRDHIKTRKRISVLDQASSYGSVTSVSTGASRISIDINLSTASMSTDKNRKRDMACLYRTAQHIEAGIGISQPIPQKNILLKLPNQQDGLKTPEPSDIKELPEVSVSAKEIEAFSADISSQSTLNLESDFRYSTVSTINLDTQHTASSLTIIKVLPGFQSAQKAETCMPKNTIPLTPPNRRNAADSQDSIHGVDDLPLDSVSQSDSKNTGIMDSSSSEDKDQFLEEQTCSDMYERMPSVNKCPVLSGCYCDSHTTAESCASFDYQNAWLPFSPSIAVVDAGFKAHKRVSDVSDQRERPSKDQYFFEEKLKQFEVTDSSHVKTKSLKPRPLSKSPSANAKNVVAWPISSEFRKESSMLKNAVERDRTSTPGATSDTPATSQNVGIFANRRKCPSCKLQLSEQNSQKSHEVDDGSITMMEGFKAGSSENLPVDCLSCHFTENKQLSIASKKKESSKQWRTIFACCAEVAVVSHDQVIIQGVYSRSSPSEDPRITKIMQESSISPQEPDKHAVGLPFKLVLSREDKATGDFQELGGFYSRRLLTRDNFFEWTVLHSRVQ